VERQNQIVQYHDEIYILTEKFKAKEKDRHDVIERLNKEIEVNNGKMLMLKTKIESLEKQNEKK